MYIRILLTHDRFAAGQQAFVDGLEIAQWSHYSDLTLIPRAALACRQSRVPVPGCTSPMPATASRATCFFYAMSDLLVKPGELAWHRALKASRFKPLVLQPSIPVTWLPSRVAERAPINDHLTRSTA